MKNDDVQLSYPMDGFVYHERLDECDVYLMQCYGCGDVADNDVFGYGRDRQCPECGSYEIHGMGTS